tara:strand:+ start:1945 stop:2319 length:375 start_codon:yes stop_codon:yes gene_type:complete
MALSNTIALQSFDAGVDLSAKKNYLIALNSSGKAILSSVNARIDGVLQNNPVSGEVASLATVEGTIVKCVASAAITLGDNLAAVATGKVKTAASTNEIIGKALEAATADGDLISVLFKHAGAEA